VRWKGREDEEQDISSYWINLRKKGDAGTPGRTRFGKRYGPVVRQTIE